MSSSPIALWRMVSNLSATEIHALLASDPQLAGRLARARPDRVHQWWASLGDADGTRAFRLRPHHHPDHGITFRSRYTTRTARVPAQCTAHRAPRRVPLDRGDSGRRRRRTAGIPPAPGTRPARVRIDRRVRAHVDARGGRRHRRIRGHSRGGPHRRPDRRRTPDTCSGDRRSRNRDRTGSVAIVQRAQDGARRNRPPAR